MTFLHSCLSCSRHPSTHAATGERCPACGLGDALPEASAAHPSPEAMLSDASVTLVTSREDAAYAAGIRSERLRLASHVEELARAARERAMARLDRTVTTGDVIEAAQDTGAAFALEALAASLRASLV